VKVEGSDGGAVFRSESGGAAKVEVQPRWRGSEGGVDPPVS